MIKKLLLTVYALLVIAGPAFPEANFRSVLPVKSATNDTVFLIGSTDTLYTRAFTIKDVQNANDIGVMYKAASGGTVDLKLEVEQSFQPPPTEGSADATYLVTETIDSSITDANWHLATIDTVVLPYMRFKVIGQGSNAAGTTFQIKVAK